MANNYCQSSTFVDIPENQIEEAKTIVSQVEKELESSDEGYAGFMTKFSDDGVLIYDEESIDPNHVEFLIKELVEQFNLPGKHLCSWAYTCSKLRINEFGGGAFVVQKGKDTVWVDAVQEVLLKVN